ncbi:MAG TPA: hypothetical protein VE781_09155 [Kineosporiaceae bacterium]|jgi:hypothetical protein|nr:hypothetical protein [Kineosporiaceae bacterium]
MNEFTVSRDDIARLSATVAEHLQTWELLRKLVDALSEAMGTDDQVTVAIQGGHLPAVVERAFEAAYLPDSSPELDADTSKRVQVAVAKIGK